MAGKARHFYPGGNTSVGFYSFFDSVFQDVERKIIFKGGPGTGKSTCFRKIGENLLRQGLDVEFLHCPSDNGSLDGIIVPALKTGLVDGTAPHTIEPVYPGVLDEIVNLGEFWDRKQLLQHKNEIVSLTDQNSACYKEAYAKFALARKTYNELEQCYIEGMDFRQADQLSAAMTEQIFASAASSGAKGQERHMFMGAATPEGPRHFYGNLTEDLQSRYIVKGRPGTGKSTMMKKIAGAAREKGYDIELYHCAFAPESIDMVLIPGLSAAMLDGTDPHVVDASLPGDTVIDMLQCADLRVYEQNASRIAELEQRYHQTMKEGTAWLAEAKRLHDQLESYYVQAMDFDRLNKKCEQIYAEIAESLK